MRAVQKSLCVLLLSAVAFSMSVVPSFAIETESSKVQLRGDVDSNGTVDFNDAAQILRHICGQEHSSEIDEALLDLLDVDANGVINLADAIHIRRSINGLSSYLNEDYNIIPVSEKAQIQKNITQINAYLGKGKEVKDVFRAFQVGLPEKASEEELDIRVRNVKATNVRLFRIDEAGNITEPDFRIKGSTLIFSMSDENSVFVIAEVDENVPYLSSDSIEGWRYRTKERTLSVENYSGEVRWTSSDSSVAYPSEATGNTISVCDGKNAGTCVITATTEEGRELSCNIVLQEPYISDNVQKITLYAGDSKTLYLIGMFCDYAEIADENVAEVSGFGYVPASEGETGYCSVKAKSGGTTTLSFGLLKEQTENGPVFLKRFDVEVEVKSPSLSNETLTLVKGTVISAEDEALQLVGVKGDVLRTSSDEEICSIDEDGSLTALKAGEADITLTNGSVSAVCHITVIDEPVFTTDYTVFVGDTLYLDFWDIPLSDRALTISGTVSLKVLEAADSANSNGFTLPDGRVKAIAPGTGSVYAYYLISDEYGTTYQKRATILVHVLENEITLNGENNAYYGQMTVSRDTEYVLSALKEPDKIAYWTVWQDAYDEGTDLIVQMPTDGATITDNRLLITESGEYRIVATYQDGTSIFLSLITDDIEISY